MPRVPKHKQQKRTASIAGGAAFRVQARIRKEVSAEVPGVSAIEEDDLIVALSDIEDDILQIGQPAGGWALAESKLPGKNPTAAATPSRQLKHYYKKKNEETRRNMQEIYGPISRFFVTAESSSTSSRLPTRNSTTFFSPPDFEITLPQDRIENDIQELQVWIKKHKPAGEWQNRVDALINLLQVENKKGRDHNWVDNSIIISAAKGKGNKWAKTLRRWHRDWQEFRIPPPKIQRGQYMTVRTLYHDEGVILVIRDYLNTARSKSTPQGICEAVGQFLHTRQAANIMGIAAILNHDHCAPTIIPALNDNPNSTQTTKISIRTAQRWLAKLGWIYSRNKKGYIDGHEREDVVDYRTNVFIPRWKDISITLREYDDNGEIHKDLPCEVKRRILITHDESTFNANDGKLYSWKPKGQEWLRPKSRGKGIMISEFLTEATGRLSVYDHELGLRQYACEIIKYGSGKNDDGWWDSNQMVKQVLEKAIPIFEKAFPNHVGVFAFDNSSGHSCKAPDALVASRMNLNPGGKQPIMHDTYYAGNVQSMVFRAGDCFWDTTIPISAGLISAPKGMKRVLQERGLWRTGLLKQCGSNKKKNDGRSGETEEEREQRRTDECVQGKDCCCLRILEAQTDFKSEKSLLELEIVKRGHEVIFYPKFHCELNYIEFFWAAVKRYTRENCSYSFSELEETVWEGLESVSLKTIRRFANRSRRWVQAYADGLTKEQKEFADKQYRSHRREYKSSLV